MKNYIEEINWDDLRNKAIQIMNTKSRDPGVPLSEDTMRLIQDMDVYRIELELENQKLRLAKDQEEKEKKVYMELFDLAPSAFIVLSPEGEISKINLQGCRILGQDRASLINTPFDLHIIKDCKETFQNYLKTVGKSLIENVELSILINNRKLKEIELSGIRLENNCLLISIADITKFKKNEEHLVRSRDRAETANLHKSSFLSTMSHEIRAPLNSIIGFSGILLQEIPGNLNEEQKKQLGMIQISGRHLLSLINDLLDLSKIEAGQLTANFENFELREVIEDVIHLEWPMAMDKGLFLNYTISPEIELINSDKQRLHQILLNLLNNAIKFTEKGSVEISAFQEQQNIRIDIKDTGVGIKEEDLEKIFDPFIQLENDLTKTYTGSGLGLPVTRKLVELLKGTISLKSEFGKGTTFTITLPI